MERAVRTAAELLAGKSRGVFSIGPAASMLEALQRFAEHDVGALLVLEDDRLVGIVDERDYARKVELAGRRAADTRVADVMSTNVLFARPQDKVDACAALMHTREISYLPVMEGDRVLGVLSERDVIEELVSEDEHLIHDLEAERLYISPRDTGAY